MAEPIAVRVCEVQQYLRNVRTRMPFRYGSATLTAVPVLHLRTLVEDRAGRRVEGWSADCLPPGWFDKTPGRTFRDDIAGLRMVVDEAVQSCLDGGRATAFQLWRGAYDHVRELGRRRGENGLTCSFGPALVERSLIDAVGKLAGTEFHATLRHNLLGTDLGSLHPELAGHRPSQHLAGEPLESLGLRQTIGLTDPLTADDVPPEGWLHDGLPQTLEQYLEERGLRYFKVKVSGHTEATLDRLRTIADLLDRHIDGRYVVSLDGNEQFRDPLEVIAFLDDLQGRSELERFVRSIQYLEQPLSRRVALDEHLAEGLAALNAVIPVAIDESDDRLDAFRTAVELGYRGVSVKNCKGVTKALGNAALAHVRTVERRPPAPYFLTAEDLMNTAIVPLQQDLATAASLGISHCERNGHHYVRGLDHLSPGEIADALDQHGSLYEPFAGDSAQLRICDGLLDLRSLRVPGYAVGTAPDWRCLTPAAEWRYEHLGLPD